MSVRELNGWLTENYEALIDRLCAGKYKPSPLRRVEIPKEERGGQAAWHTDGHRPYGAASNSSGTHTNLRTAVLGHELRLSSQSLGT